MAQLRLLKTGTNTRPLRQRGWFTRGKLRKSALSFDRRWSIGGLEERLILEEEWPPARRLTGINYCKTNRPVDRVLVL